MLTLSLVFYSGTSLKTEMAKHSSILASEIPWTGEPGGLRSWGCKELDTIYQLNNKNSCFKPLLLDAVDSIFQMHMIISCFKIANLLHITESNTIQL